MRISLLIICLFAIQPAHAEVYKSVDEDGNVIFTDQPSENAEKIHVKEIQTVKTEKPTPTEEEALPEVGLEEEQDEEAGPAYTSVEITSPENDAAIRANDGNITISAAVVPGLKADTGDHLALYMDNKLVSAGPGTQFNLSNVDRGTHSFSVAVVDKDGKELLRSAAITFTVLRHSVNQPKPAPRPAP